MLIAHLPAGYLLGRSLVAMPPSNGRVVEARHRLLAILVGSVFPDFDMLWFWFFDHQRTQHHLYWTHVPAFWLTVCAGLLLAWVAKKELRPPVAVWFFLLGVFLHLLLDSIVSDIYWLAPYAWQPFSLFAVHPHYSPWYLNFIFHWVFGVELLISTAAGALAWRDFRRHRARLQPA